MLTTDSLLSTLLSEFFPQPELVNSAYLRTGIEQLLTEHGSAYEEAVRKRRQVPDEDDDTYDEDLLRDNESTARVPIVKGLLDLCGFSYLAQKIDMRDGDWEALWELMKMTLEDADR